jgi:hypothetical protein
VVRHRFLAAAAGILLLGACEGTSPGEQATMRFAECLERNGIVAEELDVKLAADGSIEGISAVIVDEGDAPYEPTVRLACTEEVDGAQ